VRTGASLSTKQFLAHLYTHNQLIISNILFIFCFLVGGRSIAELDRKYDRCCGTLPRPERERMKEQMMNISTIDCMEKFWMVLGMDSSDTLDVEIRDHIMLYLQFLRQNVDGWKRADLPHDKIHVPPFGDTQSQAVIFKQNQALEAERELHRGYPQVYQLFTLLSKDLFDLLESVEGWGIGPTHLSILWTEVQSSGSFIPPLEADDPSRADDHRVAQGAQGAEERPTPHGLCPRILPMPCERYFLHPSFCIFCLKLSLVCLKSFPSPRELIVHWKQMGVRIPGALVTKYQDDLHPEDIPSSSSSSSSPSSSSSSSSSSGSAAPSGEKESYFENDSCVVCMDVPRQVVFVPCGHLITCKICSPKMKDCPMCRSPISSAVNVFY
jgi:hypothetical protein